MNDCIFCKIIKGEMPTSKVYENDEVFAFLDIAPVNIGHSQVVPKKHFANIYETPEKILGEMMKVAKIISGALKKGLGAQGVNLAMNNDLAAGQVVFHSHLHVIPRFRGDGFGLWHGKRPYQEGEKEETAKKIASAL